MRMLLPKLRKGDDGNVMEKLSKKNNNWWNDKIVLKICSWKAESRVRLVAPVRMETCGCKTIIV